MKVCVVLFRKLTFHFILINPTHDTESVGSTGEKTEDRWANGATPLNSRNARPNDQDYGTIGASRMSQEDDGVFANLLHTIFIDKVQKQLLKCAGVGDTAFAAHRLLHPSPHTQLTPASRRVGAINLRRWIEPGGGLRDSRTSASRRGGVGRGGAGLAPRGRLPVSPVKLVRRPLLDATQAVC
ncbi:hypothetical protein GWI33_010610 [Rhynchophorus ferrugineus]|uniref:Uncharacterized protein n=1 Tax=Rhynchophorus ferrugineus TaxID=354439 RepID=A0A834IQQ9_RHYFE|nr:hypothetical protein GWI33_010610 [Rhynchophorus ferrugineus]